MANTRLIWGKWVCVSVLSWQLIQYKSSYTLSSISSFSTPGSSLVSWLTSEPDSLLSSLLGFKSSSFFVYRFCLTCHHWVRQDHHYYPDRSLLQGSFHHYLWSSLLEELWAEKKEHRNDSGTRRHNCITLKSTIKNEKEITTWNVMKQVQCRTVWLMMKHGQCNHRK